MGEQLKKYRKEAKLTQMQLAEISGVSCRYIQKLESDEFVNPTLIIMKKISKALNTSLTDIFLVDWLGRWTDAK